MSIEPEPTVLTAKERLRWMLSCFTEIFKEDTAIKIAIGPFMPILDIGLRRMSNEEAENYCQDFSRLCRKIAAVMEGGGYK